MLPQSMGKRGGHASVVGQPKAALRCAHKRATCCRIRLAFASVLVVGRGSTSLSANGCTAPLCLLLLASGSVKCAITSCSTACEKVLQRAAWCQAWAGSVHGAGCWQPSPEAVWRSMNKRIMDMGLVLIGGPSAAIGKQSQHE